MLAALPGEEEEAGLCSHAYQQSPDSLGSPRHWGHEFGGRNSLAGWTDAPGQGDRSRQRGRHQALKGSRRRQEHPVRGQPGRAVTRPMQHPPGSSWQFLEPSMPGRLHPPQIPRASRNPASSHRSASLREKYKCIQSPAAVSCPSTGQAPHGRASLQPQSPPGQKGPKVRGFGVNTWDAEKPHGCRAGSWIAGEWKCP